MFLAIELLPAAAIILVVLLVLRKIKNHRLGDSALYAVFACYLSAVYFLVGLPTVCFITFKINLNLIPFIGMVSDLRNAVLNILLFIPLGMLLPILWWKYRKMRNTLLFGLVMSIGIELLQLLTYRATDIDDVISNTAGTVIGYCCYKMITKHGLVQTTMKRKTSDLYIILLAVFAVMFFVQPVLVSWFYAKI